MGCKWIVNSQCGRLLASCFQEHLPGLVWEGDGDILQLQHGLPVVFTGW